MGQKAIQDYYPDEASYCYGCGRLNQNGYQIKSTWDGDEAVCEFLPEPYQIAVPGYVYGGLIASLIDCHSTGAAAGASYRAAGRAMDSKPEFRFLTASLHVDFLKPTPLGVPLQLRATITELKGRKVVVMSAVFANGVETAHGEVVAVQMPERMMEQLRKQGASPRAD